MQTALQSNRPSVARALSFPIFHRPLERGLVWMGMLLLLLNLIDGIGTVRHVHHGALELNPLMAWLLDVGPGQFLLGKHLLASVGVLGILLHGENRLARLALFALVPLYACVALYQGMLFFVIP